MNRDEAVEMLARGELMRLTLAERAAYVESAVGEGLLEDQPVLTDAIGDPSNEVFDSTIVEALILRYVGTKNEYISSRIRSLGLGEANVTGMPDLLMPCPCCKYRTISQRGEYDICPVCHWEDTGSDEAEVYSGPNHCTLGEARSKFTMGLSEGTVEDASDKYLRSP